MSDDRYVGFACICLPRRYFTFFFALAFCLYGSFAVVYFLVFKFLMGPPMTPKHCSGHHCGDILTCDAARDASYHVREVVVILGGAVFGFQGCIGIWQGVPYELQLFTGFLIGMAALLLFLDLYDGAYILICNAFPYRIVQQALLWPIYNEPVTEAIKWQIEHGMTHYHVDYIYRLTRIHVMSLFFTIELTCVAVLLYAAYCVNLMRVFNTTGFFGLGPNFSISDWKQRGESVEHMRHNIHMMKERALRTADDVAWKPMMKVKKEAVDDMQTVAHGMPGATRFVQQEFHQVGMYMPDTTAISQTIGPVVGKAVGKLASEVVALPDNPFSALVSARQPSPTRAPGRPGVGASGSFGRGSYGSVP